MKVIDKNIFLAKEIISQVSSYMWCYFLGLVFFVVAYPLYNLLQPLSCVLLNISAVFISIPTLYYLYELQKKQIERNKYKTEYEEFKNEIIKKSSNIISKLFGIILEEYDLCDIFNNKIDNLDIINIENILNRKIYYGSILYTSELIKEEKTALLELKKNNLFNLLGDGYQKNILFLIEKIEALSSSLNNDFFIIFEGIETIATLNVLKSGNGTTSYIINYKDQNRKVARESFVIDKNFDVGEIVNKNYIINKHNIKQIAGYIYTIKEAGKFIHNLNMR